MIFTKNLCKVNRETYYIDLDISVYQTLIFQKKYFIMVSEPQSHEHFQPTNTHHSNILMCSNTYNNTKRNGQY